MKRAQIKAVLWAVTLLVAQMSLLLWGSLSSADGWLLHNLILSAIPIVPIMGLTFLFLKRVVSAKPFPRTLSLSLFGIGFAAPIYTLLAVAIARDQIANLSSFLIGFNVVSFVFLAVHLHIHRGLADEFTMLNSK